MPPLPVRYVDAGDLAQLLHCKHCGRITSYTMKVPVTGVWTWTVDERGVAESDAQDVKYGADPKTVTCEDCGKRSPNPNLKETSPGR